MLEVKFESVVPNIQLDTPSNYSENNVLSTIENISTEITKWDKASDISEQALTQLDSFSLKPAWVKQYHLKVVNSVRRLVSSWNCNNTSCKWRAPQLTKDQRNSLQVIYDLHIKLKDLRSKLSVQMKELGISEEIQAESQEPSTSSLTMSQSLQRIRWKGDIVYIHSGLNNYQKENFDANSWPSWDKNPYSNFYDSEEEFKQDIEVTNQLRNQIFRDQRYSKVQNLTVGSGRHSEHNQKLANTFRNLVYGNYSYKHIIVKVAQKILKEIDQSV
ncbi:hypothetical protein DNK47_02165 [Mycoplasma wenyonii]|uniref:Uncharacterized protein n=1 Tax=Mycoplasma wenyonii TaxID=65123 RepID=A0A328PTE5_9MOLU|nr:hypothetical protein [Mycoplasma wenyonii]RAO95000.1 hypothetical protein DNK47_02165 [Mycoplasma wenyonii]